MIQLKEKQEFRNSLRYCLLCLKYSHVIVGQQLILLVAVGHGDILQTLVQHCFTKQRQEQNAATLTKFVFQEASYVVLNKWSC